MQKISKLLIIMIIFIFVAACVHRNEYGVPTKQWDKISKHEQSLIEQSNQQMTFNDTD
jgi:hypothetical protein